MAFWMAGLVCSLPQASHFLEELFLAVDFLAVELFLAPVDFLAVPEVLFLAPVDFLAVEEVLFLAPVDFLAVPEVLFLAVDFLAVEEVLFLAAVEDLVMLAACLHSPLG